MMSYLLVLYLHGNRNGNELVEDSLEEEMVWMPSTEVTGQAPKGPIAQVPGPPEEIPPAPVAQVPGPPASAAVWRSTRQTRPLLRYGDSISQVQMTLIYCDVWEHNSFQEEE